MLPENSALSYSWTAPGGVSLRLVRRSEEGKPAALVFQVFTGQAKPPATAAAAARLEQLIDMKAPTWSWIDVLAGGPVPPHQAALHAYAAQELLDRFELLALRSARFLDGFLGETQICEICGCDEDHACLTHQGGEILEERACSWAGPGLCSACADSQKGAAAIRAAHRWASSFEAQRQQLFEMAEIADWGWTWQYAEDEVELEQSYVGFLQNLVDTGAEFPAGWERIGELVQFDVDVSEFRAAAWWSQISETERAVWLARGSDATPEGAWEARQAAVAGYTFDGEPVDLPTLESVLREELDEATAEAHILAIRALRPGESVEVDAIVRAGLVTREAAP